jgi:transcriptional regulator GlxA family with amidase domain
MPAASIRGPVNIKLLAVPETTAMILYAFYDVFRGFELLWAKLAGGPDNGVSFEPKIVSPVEGTFTCGGGVPVTPHESLNANAVPDVVIVPDVYLPPEDSPRGRWPEAAAYLKRMHDAGATVCSVCTGSLVLADAGLLDGRKATTHWGYVDMFRRHFPNVELEPERIFVPADLGGTIITTGGPATWEELALYLIARYRGEAAAVQASKIYLLGDRSEGATVYAALLRPRRHDDRIIADAQAWLADNYAEATVAALVARSGLAERTFKRRFRAATGYTPIDYLQTLRTEEAKQLLESSPMPVDDVGAAVGYEDPTFFRRLFRRSTGVTPSRYRQRFRGIGAA